MFLLPGCTHLILAAGSATSPPVQQFTSWWVGRHYLLDRSFEEMPSSRWDAGAETSLAPPHRPRLVWPERVRSIAQLAPT